MKEFIEKLQKYTKNLSVLYVEDDTVIQDQTHEFLSRFFSRIDLAQNGTMGLILFEGGKYDIVITDINMPEMNGIDMITKMRESNEEQVIIVTSAYNETDYFISLINLGVDKFVMKPFDNKHFLKVLYSVTKTIYARKREEHLEGEVKKRAHEMKTILNMMNEAICVLEEGVIIEFNRRFAMLMGFKDRQTLLETNFQIPNIIDAQAGFLQAKDNAELIEKLCKSDFDKVVLRFGNSLRTYLIRLAKVEDEGEKYILTFVDVSELESQVETDEVTRLPNRNFLIKKITERRKKNQPFNLILFCVKNMENIAHWHGSDAPLEVEKQLGRVLPRYLKELPESIRPEVAYLGSNRFVFLIQENAKGTALEQIDALGKLQSRKSAGEGHENESITLQFQHIILDTSDHPQDEIIKAIEQGFSQIGF